ncbi:MAG: SDR family oxidoreductase [Candidatus Hydrogenedentes bacterium]|nr:SDR family oxidoreductase [Candidatus Hydrogenedentota bacterium]
MACYLVTGGAGFIGSHLVGALIEHGHAVRVIDDFSSGRRENIAAWLGSVELYEGSICDRDLVQRAMRGADYCLHHAAIASVPRSVSDPWQTNRVNVEGTLNLFLAARDAGVRRLVVASSSAVYGNAESVPVNESLPIAPLSPYGVSKAADELYAQVFSSLYAMDIVCLRYFNVFGPRQDPTSQYAAVVPIFIARMLAGQRPPVYGDGLQSRDFCHVDNVVEANLRACEAPRPFAGVYNIACGQSTTVLELVKTLNEILGTDLAPEFQPLRPGDVRHSWADISRAQEQFGYEPRINLREGLGKTVKWFREKDRAASDHP